MSLTRAFAVCRPSGRIYFGQKLPISFTADAGVGDGDSKIAVQLWQDVTFPFSNTFVMGADADPVRDERVPRVSVASVG